MDLNELYRDATKSGTTMIFSLIYIFVLGWSFNLGLNGLSPGWDRTLIKVCIGVGLVKAFAWIKNEWCSSYSISITKKD